jgi:hypothetical protein
MSEPIDVCLPGTGEPWFTFGMGFESRRLSPGLTPDEVVLIERNPALRPAAELHQAADSAMYDLVVDTGLRSRLRDVGVDRVYVTPVFVDEGDEPRFRSPRCKLRRGCLDVDAWFYDDGPADSAGFQAWVREKVRGVLESWVDQHAEHR